MGVWRKGSNFGKAKILELVKNRPNCTIYQLYHGSPNYRVYYNLRELLEHGYIKGTAIDVNNKTNGMLLEVTKKGKDILENLQDNENKILL